METAQIFDISLSGEYRSMQSVHRKLFLSLEGTLLISCTPEKPI